MKYIDIITFFTNMTFKENNGNAIIMKCYVKVWISIWCISMKYFRVMSSSMIWTWPVGVKLLDFHEKCYVIGHWKWWWLCCTRPCWEWSTCGGCQPTPMVDDLCYDMISGIPSIAGNAGCLAQCAGSLPNLYILIRHGLTNIYIIYEHLCYFMIMREWFCWNALWA